MGRWEAGRIAQLLLLGDRELDVCLMRRDQRWVYRSVAVSAKQRDTGAQLAEVRDRERLVKQVQRQQRQKPDAVPVSPHLY